MTSRERVKATIEFKEPDRVPIDLGGMKATGINALTYARLKERLGMRSPTRILDPRFMIAVVEEEVLSRFHGDVLPVDLAGIVDAVRPEAGLRREDRFLGRRLRHAVRSPERNPGRSARAREGPSAHLRSRRRLRVRAGSQCAGQGAARKRPGAMREAAYEFGRVLHSPS